MAASVDGVLQLDLREKVDSCRVLVVGAGGIGCELLKNLVLSGFKQIKVIDLDTIDVSNLNRQFLFRKEHVGMSKAKVARDSTMVLNPSASIEAFHDSIMSPDYGVKFFQEFDIVMNALDNRAARNHVNRMCLAADVPLIESGTAGYLGQVTVIKKKLTECYECQPKPAQKTFPGCTIRNTPSEPIHCIVWAKHLFNQLYGEYDPDQDVSPDTEDPEAAGDAGKAALVSESKQNAVGGIERKSTRVWATESSYDSTKLFNKFFHDDIQYLLSMENLWKKRRPPTPLDMTNLPDCGIAGAKGLMILQWAEAIFELLDVVGTKAVGAVSSRAGLDNGYSAAGLINDQRVWSIKECAEVFAKSVTLLKNQLSVETGEDGVLIWDKDDQAAMDFVASASNIRAHIFGIQLKSRFDIKSMAGNIIPAIASTNAVIAGLIVLEAFKVLAGKWNECRTVYLNRQPNTRKKLLVPCILDKPSPKCYVCVEKPQVVLQVNVNSFTVKSLEDKVLKSNLGMVAPDVEIDDGKGTILISSEEGETEDNWSKVLSDFGIACGSQLKCDDFLQDYNLTVNIVHVDSLPDGKDFEVVGEISELRPESSKSDGNPQQTVAAANGPAANEPDDEDIIMMEDDELSVTEPAPLTDSLSRKRKALDPVEESTQNLAKRICAEENSDDVEIL